MTVEPSPLPAQLSPTAIAGAPAWVRKGSAEVQRDYALGLEFERLLAQQLASSLAATAGIGEGAQNEEEGSAPPQPAGSGPYSTMLSGALADGASAAGGLGLANELARDMAARAGNGAPVDPAAGGTAARQPGAGS